MIFIKNIFRLDFIPLTMELTLSSLPALSKVHNEVHRTTIGLPPTFSRLPPDGHEFPQTYSEPSNHNKITTHSMVDQLPQKSPPSQKIVETKQLTSGAR